MKFLATLFVLLSLSGCAVSHPRITNKFTGQTTYFCGNCGTGWRTETALNEKGCRECTVFVPNK